VTQWSKAVAILSLVKITLTFMVKISLIAARKPAWAQPEGYG
jgi:hypothetical protein